MTNEVIKKLSEAALDVRKKAYCPYSGFAVGAALLAKSGASLTSSGNGIPDKLFLCLKLCRVGRKSFLFDFLLFLIQPPLCPILCLGHAHSGW